MDHKERTNTIHTIGCAVNDGAEMTRRMLKFIRTEEDETGFALHDINDLLKQAIDFIKPRWKNMAHAKGIIYHVDKKSIGKVLHIMCNPTEIREVLVNMINNSLDAMPGGGCMSFRTWSNMDAVFIRVSDDGEGMSDEVKKKVLDPFFTTKSVGGTGLGLSMVYGIVNRHGGKIELESEARKGCTFTLQFPIPTKKTDRIKEMV